MAGQIDSVLNMLEHSYSGAKMMGDTVVELRISRAIAALKAPVEQEIFTEEFKEWWVSKECEIKNCRNCRHITVMKGKLSYCLEKNGYVKLTGVCGEWKDASDNDL